MSEQLTRHTRRTGNFRPVVRLSTRDTCPPISARALVRAGKSRNMKGLSRPATRPAASLSPNLQKTSARAVYASNSRLTAGKARLRLFGGKNLPTNPCEHFKCEMLARISTRVQSSDADAPDIVSRICIRRSRQRQDRRLCARNSTPKARGRLCRIRAFTVPAVSFWAGAVLAEQAGLRARLICQNPALRILEFAADEHDKIDQGPDAEPPLCDKATKASRTAEPFINRTVRCSTESWGRLCLTQTRFRPPCLAAYKARSARSTISSMGSSGSGFTPATPILTVLVLRRIRRIKKLPVRQTAS